MKIAIGADHGGFELKEQLKTFLINEGYDIEDFGATDFDELDDFPDYALSVANSVANGKNDRGVLVCGSGLGVCMAANRVKGIRAFNCTCEDFAILSRKHNDSNVICFPGRFIAFDEAKKYLLIWLETEFLAGKYKSRNDKLDD